MINWVFYVLSQATTAKFCEDLVKSQFDQIQQFTNLLKINKMEKNQEASNPMVLKTGETILINGVVITPEFLEFIKGWRNEDNAIIIEIQNDISDATTSLLFAMDYMYEEYNEFILRNIKELNQTKRNLKYLMSPQKQA